MEVISRLELLVGSVGVIIGIFLSLFLIFKRKGFAKTNIFLAFYFLVFSVRMMKSLFYQYINVSTTTHQIFLSSLATIGPSLWFYFLLSTKKKISKKDYFLHYSPFLVLIILSFFIDFGNEAYFYLGLFFHGLLYACYLLYSVFINQYVKEKSSLKKWLLLLIGATVLLFLNSIFIYFKLIPFYPSSAFLFSLIMVCLSIYGLNNIELFKIEKVKYVNSNLSKEEATKYYNVLKKLVEEDKIYLDAELSLTKLSKLIGISSKQLSQVINQVENTNYSQYIMKYRVEEAKRKLKNPKYANYKISAIAFESGFNSISSFNNAFKKITNITANQYKAS